MRTCTGCGSHDDVRLMCARRFVIQICDECVLSVPDLYRDGNVLRMTAVATEAFASKEKAA